MWVLEEVEHEYLLELRNTHGSRKRGSGKDEVSEGDVVIIQEDNEKRGFWKLGLIEEVIYGGDERIRGAVVKVRKTGRKCSKMRRPVQRLYPIESSYANNSSSQRSAKDTLNEPSSGSPDMSLRNAGNNPNECRR